MTVNRTQVFHLPSGIAYTQRGEFLRFWRPQMLNIVASADDGRDLYFKRVLVRALDEDRLEEIVLSSYYVPESPFRLRNRQGILDFPKEANVYEREGIRDLVGEAWGGQATGILGQDVHFDWEPTPERTLPSQARK